jgi:hypothetical protein
MKVLYLVESDTDYASLFAWQLERVWSDDLHIYVYRKVDGGMQFADLHPAQFFGNLNSLLRTRITPDAPRLELAAPDLPMGPVALAEIPSPGIGAEEAEAADARAAEEAATVKP